MSQEKIEMSQEKLMRTALRSRLPVRTKGGDKRWLIADLRDLGNIYEGKYPYISIGDTRATDTISHTIVGNCYEGSTCGDDIVALWVDPHPLADMPVDHPIYVRDSDRDDWSKRHFCAVVLNGKKAVTTFSARNTVSDWASYRLPTKDELKGTPWEDSPFTYD